MPISLSNAAKTCLGLSVIAGLISIFPWAFSQPADNSLGQHQRHSRAITVRVMDGNRGIGSGTIIGVNRGVYLVITNRHVLPMKQKSLKVQTTDYKIYPVQVVAMGLASSEERQQPETNIDLALLEFQARDQIYATAHCAPALPKIGESVIATGFPQTTAQQPQPEAQLEIGSVSGLAAKPLADGYQIGHNLNIQKGMSGGPLINQQGQLIGINGLHSYPLWEAIETYADGSAVEEPLQSQIKNSSWAIPAHRISALGWGN